ncbi:winged helix-turn-helix domain-containing protein [Pyrobaculum ferrireducens]|uniref:Regulatory protein, ArsR n=1 Tax=Pyrobaculum ferrireducens TaxID=1104324 RepID=G7VHH0_9CREN|nr:winged helix-turn-helix domain-containing protein [Pyrobaculum ferrireducens]AET33261.1 regulatory protein, ArsR [Pyrobaculum ferrireducens]
MAFRHDLWLDDRAARKLFQFLFYATRGGPTRLEIVKILMKKPMNANEIAKSLGLDYKTVRHHLEVLTRHGVLERLGEGYGSVYVPSQLIKK